jgi:xylulokinase
LARSRRLIGARVWANYGTRRRSAVTLTLPAHGRADLYRALLEGIAYGTRHALETYAAAGAAPQVIRAVGGGLHNPVWTKATSDVSGRAQETLKSSLGASFGDAFLAALAIGDVGVDAIQRWNPVVARIEPDAANGAVYARQYGVFRELYDRNRDLMARLDA